MSILYYMLKYWQFAGAVIAEYWLTYLGFGVGILIAHLLLNS